MILSNLNKVAAIALITLLQACATPVGKFTDDDFVWDRRTIQKNYQAVYRTTFETSRKCGGLVTEGNLYTDIGEGVIDIYLGNGVLGGRSDWVAGTIRIKSLSADITQVSVGVVRKYDNPIFGKKGGNRELMKKWTDGVSGC